MSRLLVAPSAKAGAMTRGLFDLVRVHEQRSGFLAAQQHYIFVAVVVTKYHPALTLKHSRTAQGPNRNSSVEGFRRGSHRADD